MGERGRAGQSGADSGRKLTQVTTPVDSTLPAQVQEEPPYPARRGLVPAQPTISLQVSFLPLTSER